MRGAEDPGQARVSPIAARVLFDGEARGRVLRLSAPISFWGGIDPASAEIVDPRHPQHGVCVRGRVLSLAATRGSSSSSAVLLELLYRGRAPAAIVLVEPDAILALGILVAREMGWRTMPLLQVDTAAFEAIGDGMHVRIARGGVIEPQGS